jgi:hypothetical protein
MGLHLLGGVCRVFTGFYRGAAGVGKRGSFTVDDSIHRNVFAQHK